MRHNKKFNPLGRTASHRQAMLSNMANSLIEHKRIITTLAKAKALKVYAEPLITTAIKNGESVHARRIVFQKLQNRNSVVELFGPSSEKAVSYTHLDVYKRQYVWWCSSVYSSQGECR